MQVLESTSKKRVYETFSSIIDIGHEHLKKEEVASNSHISWVMKHT